MLSVHRSVLFITRSSLAVVKSDHIRRIFLSGGRFSNRQPRSSFQNSRRVELTPSSLNVNGNPSGQGHPRILVPVLFAFGVSKLVHLL